MSKANVVLGVSGSVAAYKACDIIKGLQEHDCDVKVIMTESSKQFVTPLTLEIRSKHKIFNDMFADAESLTPHIHYAERADIFLVAPASANTLAKLAYGLADDALSATCLAATCKKIVAPAMNTNMYENEATQNNLKILKQRGFVIIEPDEGNLACGDVGKGKLASTDKIVDTVLANL